MKMKKILAMAVMGILALGFSSCENGDADFPDYEGGVNVYFAHQFLDRTVVLGDAETLNTQTITTISSVSSPQWVVLVMARTLP